MAHYLREAKPDIYPSYLSFSTNNAISNVSSVRNFIEYIFRLAINPTITAFAWYVDESSEPAKRGLLSKVSFIYEIE